jgi:hypothetical protein
VRTFIFFPFLIFHYDDAQKMALFELQLVEHCHSRAYLL